MTVLSTTTILLTATCLSATCYAVTSGVEYLCTHPERIEGRVQGVFDAFREKCANFRDSSVSFIGERNWSAFSACAINNAWISTFVITCFLLFFPAAASETTIKFVELIVVSFLYIGIVSFYARLGIQAHLPHLATSFAEWAAPRSPFPHNH